MATWDVKKIREDFPALWREREDNKRLPIFFDSAAGTIPPRPVIEALRRYSEHFPSSSARSRHWWANEVTWEVHRARNAIARLLNVENAEELGDPLTGSPRQLGWPIHVIFTKNTTEAINLVARGLFWEEGEVVVTGDREHNSNRCPWWDLARTRGIKVRIIKRGGSDAPDAEFDIEDFLDRLEAIERHEGTVKLVSLAQTYNIDGYTIPEEAIMKLTAYCHSEERRAKGREIYVMLDAAQSAPHRRIDVQRLDVDFLAFSGHKMLGPTGTGICYMKNPDLLVQGLWPSGGGTVTRTFDDDYPLYADPPARFEAGLQHWAGIIGFGVAVNYLQDKLPFLHEHEVELNRFITESLWEYHEEGIITILGPKDVEKRSSIFTFEVPPFDEGEDPGRLQRFIEELLDTANIMVRTGDYCVHPYALSRRAARIRLSFYLYNTLDEGQVFLDLIRPFLNWRREGAKGAYSFGGLSYAAR